MATEQLHPAQSFPQWTMQGIEPGAFEGEREGGGDLPYYRTPEGFIFWGQEDAQEHVQKNYWDPAEIDLPQVIKDLEGTNVKDFGAIPSYLLDSNADLMDSSTWDPDAVDPSTYYVSPADANRTIISDMNESEVMDYLNRVDPKGDNMSIFGKEYADIWDKTGPLPYQRTLPVHESVNVLDYYASQGNPELRRSSKTGGVDPGGFFPTEYYPEAGIWGLRKNLKERKLFERYTDPKSLARYNTTRDMIGFDWEDLYDAQGNIDRGKLARSAGHEGLHMAIEPHQRGEAALEYDLPYPKNYLNQTRWPLAVGHPAVLYSDNLFFPGQRSNVGISKEGWENLKTIMNWTPPDTSQRSPGQGQAAPIGRAQDYTARQVKQSPKDYTTPRRAQVGPPGYNYNTGGLASLML